MKVVVIGGTGLIGSETVAILRQGGHEVVAASPQSGINTTTGEGLKVAVAGAQVVIDLANSPSFEDKAVLEFFETSGRNLLAAEAAAGGIRHHVALSIVGTDRSDNGYFRAKVAQEKLIKTAGIPYTIIRSTQFLEFLGGIADSSADGNIVRISPGLFQPIAADDVAAIVADVALVAPQNGIVEIAGPERAPFNEIVARYLKAVGDPRKVASDPEARYFGGRVEERSLVPLGEARLGRIGFDGWLRRSRAAACSRIRQPKDSGSMKCILFALLVATLPFGSVLADAPKEKNAKVTLVYQHELPNVPGKSIKGVLVEYGPGGYSPGHTHPKSAFIYATVLEGAIRSQVQRRTGDDLQRRTKLLRAARRPPRRQRQCQRDAAGQAPRGVCGGHKRDEADDPIRGMRSIPGRGNPAELLF
jgi:uncharacterized protein YbjT (DUF2867 family)